MHGTIYEFETLPRFRRHGPGLVPRGPSYVPRGRAVPLVGIVRNRRSHRNKESAAELASCSNILTQTPESREDLRASLEMFAARGIDYLVIDGGDGTVRDVLTCGADIFGETWPTLAVLPKGKTNALAVDIGLPNHWSLSEALVAARKGRVVHRRPLRITSAEADTGSVQGFLLGAGVFTIATEAGQAAHRRGAFNSFAVGLTILWVLIQTLFGRAGNPWRASTRMRLRDRRSRRELPHSGRGDVHKRFLTIATTFESFPLGLRPFGRDVPEGLKLAVLDSPVRWVLMLLPAIMMGFFARFIGRAGVHRFLAQAIDFELDEAFILDGESFPGGRYILEEGPQLTFVVP